MKFALSLVLLALLSTFVQGADVTHTKDTLPDIRKAVEEGKAVIVDVREQDEWTEGHIKGATFLPLSAVKRLKSAPDNLPKDKPLYVHCAAGVRSLKAAAILKDFGLDVRPLKPGYVDLTEAGFASEAKK